jgi:hypothetical protein
MASERAGLVQRDDGKAERSAGNARLFVAAFLMTALAATAVGTAGSGGALLSSFPTPDFLGSKTVEAPITAPKPWGELRFVHKVTHVRADRTTKSAILVKLAPGDSVRVDGPENNWYAVFPPDATQRHAGTVIGYVYAPLLKDSPPGR